MPTCLIRPNRRLPWLLLLVLAPLAGCRSAAPITEPAPGRLDQFPRADLDNRVEQVKINPLAYLRETHGRCAELDQYTLNFVRQERRGLFGLLFGPEHISCRFRAEPFSVYMKWLDDDIKYGESVYVEDADQNRVRFVTRWWSPPLLPPPAVNRVSLMMPVTWGESKRPLTDFGLERLMARTLASIDTGSDQMVMQYQGLTQLPDDGPLVHHFHFEFPVTHQRVPVQDLYIDVNTDLPAGTILRLPDDRIDAAYFYTDVNTDVNLTDDDFLLPAEREKSAD